MVGTSAALGALPESMVARELANNVLWPITPTHGTVQAEAIWMVRSPSRQESRILNHFVSLIQTRDDSHGA